MSVMSVNECNVDGDDMKMKKRRRRWRKSNVFEL